VGKWEFSVFSNKHVMNRCVPVVSAVAPQCPCSAPRLLAEGSGRAAPCSEGTFALGVNQEQRKGSVPAPPSALRKVPGVFQAPL